MIKSIQLQ